MVRSTPIRRLARSLTTHISPHRHGSLVNINDWFNRLVLLPTQCNCINRIQIMSITVRSGFEVKTSLPSLSLSGFEKLQLKIGRIDIRPIRLGRFGNVPLIRQAECSYVHKLGKLISITNLRTEVLIYFPFPI